MAYIAFVLCCLRSFLASVDIETSFVTVLMNIFIILGIDFTKIKRKIILFTLYVFIVLILFSFNILNAFNVLMLVYILRDEKIDHLVLLYLGLSIVFGFIVFLLLQFGYLHSSTFLSHKGGMVSDCGFHNVNSLALFEFNIVCALSILLRKNKNIIILAVYLILGITIYSTTLSRSSLMSIIGISLGYMMYYSGWINKSLSKLIAILPLIISIVLFYIIFHLDDYPELKVLSSGRLNIFSNRIENIDMIHFFTGIDLEPGPYDGGYYMIFFFGGILWLLFFIFEFYYNISHYYQQYRPYIPFLLGIIIYSIGESYIALATGMNIIFWLIILHTKGFITNSSFKVRYNVNKFNKYCLP